MPDQDKVKPAEPAPDETEAGGGGANGWSNRVRRNFSPERFLRSGPSRRRSVAETGSAGRALTAKERSQAARTAVNKLNPFELRLGITAAVCELLLTLVVVVPYLMHNHNRSASELKTLSAVHVFLVEGIVLFVFVLLGTLLKRRALLGFASVLVGLWLFALPSLRLIGLVYMGFGVWLMFKGFKSTQKEARGAERGAARQPTPRRSRTSDKSPAGRSAPKPSKRYTPPKATRRPAPKKPASARAEPPKH
ncbi:MAG: hypothetical protein WAV54_17990 [Acidimicrobiales bacterium]